MRRLLFVILLAGCSTTGNVLTTDGGSDASSPDASPPDTGPSDASLGPDAARGCAVDAGPRVGCPCEDDDGCPSAEPWCIGAGGADGVCGACRDDDDCGGDAPLCVARSGLPSACGACRDDEDCTGGDACDAETHRCAPCPDCPRDCGAAPLAFAGSLCGADVPCVVAEHTVMEQTTRAHYAPPSIVASGDDVWVAYSSVVDDARVAWAARRSDGFALDPLPVVADELSLGSDGESVFLAASGVFEGWLLAHDEGWDVVHEFPGAVTPAALQVDGGGCAHWSYQPRSEMHHVVRWDGLEAVQTTVATGGVSGGPGALALDQGGAVHVAYMGDIDGTIGLYHQTLDGPPARVPDAPWLSLTSRVIRMRVLEGAPHVLFEGSADDVRYGTLASGTWTAAALAVPDPTEALDCPSRPSGLGEACLERHVDTYPIDLVVSGAGDVRVFIAEVVVDEQLETESCPFPDACLWRTVSETTTGRLVMLTPGGSSQVVAALPATGGSADVDATGAIHIAVSVRTERDEDLSVIAEVHHLQLGGCRPEQVAFPMGGTLEEGTICDEVTACVADEDLAAIVALGFSCREPTPGECAEPEAGTYCTHAVDEGRVNVLDAPEVEQVCGATLLDGARDLTCRVFL